MSIVAGPPESQIWITPVAGFFTRGSGAFRASARSASGRLIPSSPATPTRRTSRRWNPSQSVRVRDIAVPPNVVGQVQWFSTNSRVLINAQSTSARPEAHRGSSGDRRGRRPRPRMGGRQ